MRAKNVMVQAYQKIAEEHGDSGDIKTILNSRSVEGLLQRRLANVRGQQIVVIR